ncbi:UBP1-associated protein 2A-like [Oryza glaberrima]|uniref:RRM domain-containing protein n=1 Tax=Oryza glaberrima TaxID=4538 RepID=I1R1H5_ORYGL|nr:UBP1-associated protein 2A-like [Oryza glaberrima]
MEKKKEKPNRKRRKPRQDPSPDSGPDSDSDSDCSPLSSPTSLRRLLDPYSKPRLLALLSDAAADDPTLLARIRAAADASPSHRRLFVHGLPPHADESTLAEAFSRFGPLAECDVVARRATGACKGFGFVTFLSRAAARRALRGGVVVAGRAVSAQFATAGADPSSGAAAAGRRVYVTNVAPGASAERLRAFFAGFGELEGGPFGFDADTGSSSRGCALFVYRAAEGARRALEEPYRVFEGRTLHCQLAADPARKSKPRAPPPPPPAPAAVASPLPALQPVLDAVVASGVGDLAKYAQNPAQAAALLGKNPILAAAVLNSALASTTAALKPNPAAASSINPAAVARSSPVAAPAMKPLAPRSPAADAAAVVPSPVKIGAGISGGAGLLGPYKPPSSPMLASSIGQRDQC